MEVRAGAGFPLAGTIHPKIEPEIAFRIGKTLRGKVGREDAIQACSGATAALEILDSRFKDFKYFSLEDVVADNSSSSHFILGTRWTELAKLDLPALELSLSHDGEVVQKALGSAISGDPLNSLLQLCELLDSRGGLPLPAGSIVLAGAATAAVQLKPGSRIRLSVPGLDEIEVLAR
jgi:2-oxo-3-hexenedioate decarboxylase